MSIGRILFLAIFLFSASTVLATGSLLEKITYDSIDNLRNVAGLEELEIERELRENYRQDLLKVINQAVSDEISDDVFEERLLALTVPAKYRELHFNLVTAVTELNPVGTNDLDLAKSKLEQIKATYSWLAANLSLLIINSF